MKARKKTISAYTIMLKALSNETRLSILYSLHERPKTWTEMIFELKVNPKSLRDHLDFLKKSKLVRRSKPVGFELTDAGKSFIEMSLNDIIETVEKAAQIAQK